MESIKYIALYTGIGGLVIALSLRFFKTVITQKLLTKLSKDQSYKVLKMIIYMVFIIAITGIGAYIYIETQNSYVTSDSTDEVKCPLKEGTKNLTKRIDELIKNSGVIDNDDFLILDALNESLKKQLKIIRKCDEWETSGIQSEIGEAKRILYKYEKQ